MKKSQNKTLDQFKIQAIKMNEKSKIMGGNIRHTNGSIVDDLNGLIR
ncbi:MAG: hypothetical protein ACI8ZM_000426 [Crocinitomix sp.]|jgi:hypothetical protein